MVGGALLLALLVWFGWLLFEVQFSDGLLSVPSKPNFQNRLC